MPTTSSSLTSLARSTAARWCGVIVVVALLASVPGRARADDGEGVAYFLAGVFVSPFVNLIGIAEQDRPPWGWIAGGIVSGIFLAAVGIWGLSDEWASTGTGIGLIIWGVVCFGLAIGAAAQPEHGPSDRRYALLEWG